MGKYTNGYLDSNKRYHVAKGDCLWNIALEYMGNGRRYPEIKQANGLSSNVIYVGNVFIIPGISPGYGGGSSSPAPSTIPSGSQKPNIVWFSLRADTEREMEIIWEHTNNKFKIRYEMYDSKNRIWLESEETPEFTSDQQRAVTHAFESSTDRFRCRVRIKSVDKDGNDLSGWVDKEYDFRNNPPKPPESPEIEITNTNNKDNLIVKFNNIEENVGIDKIEVFVYKDNSDKCDSFIIDVNKETRYASHTVQVEPGHYYRVKARSIRYTLPDGTTRSEGIKGGWTDFTENVESSPIAPTEILVLTSKKIVEQGNVSYGVNIEWTPVSVAKTYTVQWTTNPDYFETNPNAVESQDTEEGKGPKLLLTGINMGYTYYFRVCSNNDKGASLTWTPIKTLTLGSKPSAPTTWSNTNNNIQGEDLNLYWTHNATDGSLETYARLHLELIDSKGQSLEKDEVVENTRSDDDPNRISVFTINASNPEYSTFLDGNSKIKWKVQTAGVGSEYSEWSVEREVNVYTRPEIIIDIKNKYDESITDIFEFPFSIDLLAKPSSQLPISYYIEIISNNAYETVDNFGIVKSINVGDIIYSRYVDPKTEAWQIRAYLTPSDVDLQSGFSYTVRASVSMNSGLTATSEQIFSTEFGSSAYDIFADIFIDKETLKASIKPYAKEWYYENGEPFSRTAENCVMSVYRREYDGTFTEIGTGIPNGEDISVSDPHPALDYARYRVIVRSSANGTISYRDIDPVKIGEPSIVIQWAESWKRFETSDEETTEPSWSGSMIKIPYNVDVSEKTNPDVTMVDYIGRKNPVSYYGTKIGETAQWNVEIPIDDKDMIYALRRLSKWMDNVYVREPSGIGYWANITVNFSLKHKAVTIPISFDIKRVEGGI